MPTGKTICIKSGMLTKEINIGHKVDLEFLVMGKPSILILSCIRLLNFILSKYATKIGVTIYSKPI